MSNEMNQNRGGIDTIVSFIEIEFGVKTAKLLVLIWKIYCCMERIKRTKSNSNNADEPSSSQRLIDLRKTNTFCDALLLLEDGGCIPVHRIVLCTASEYFYNLFMSPIRAELENGYLIKYVRTTIMECIVEFVYTSKCDVNEENVVELITTAEYFCLFPLIDRCSEFILSILNMNNCVSLMCITRKFLYKHEIQRKVREYILYNFLEIVSVNNDILKLSCEELLDIISDDGLNTKNKEPIWEFCLRWIEFDEENRLKSIPSLLGGVRLGLLGLNFFEQRVLNHHYVKLCPEAKPIVDTAYKFVSDFSEMEWFKDSDIDISPLVPRLPRDILFCIGGWFEGTACTLISTFDIRADRWIEFKKFKDPQGPRAYHSAAVIGNKIYCIGGYSGSEYYNKCTVFDVITKTWAEIAPMHFRRCYVSICVLNGKIYAMGGHDGHSRLRTTEVYCPETNQWTLLANMMARRSDADASEIDGKIYVFGGFDGSICLRSAEVYDITQNKWSFIPDMQSARSGLKCVAYKNQIYVCGGYNGQNRLSSCETFNPDLNYWVPIDDMNSPRSNFGIEVMDDAIFVVGGFDGLSTINKVEYYRCDENKWKIATGMSHHRSAHAIAKVTNIQNVEDYVYESVVAHMDTD